MTFTMPLFMLGCLLVFLANTALHAHASESGAPSANANAGTTASPEEIRHCEENLRAYLHTLKSAKNSNKQWSTNGNLIYAASKLKAPSLAPLFLEIAEALGRLKTTPNSTDPDVFDALQAAEEVANVDEQLFSFIANYENNRQLAASAIVVLARRADEAVAKRIDEIVAGVSKDDLFMQNVIRWPWGPVKLAAEYNAAKDVHEKLSVIMPHVRLGGERNVYEIYAPFSNARLRALSEEFPQEAASALFKKREYEKAWGNWSGPVEQTRGDLYHLKLIAARHLGKKAQTEFATLRKSREAELAKEEAERLKKYHERIREATRASQASRMAEFLEQKEREGANPCVATAPGDPRPLVLVRGMGIEFGLVSRIVGEFRQEGDGRDVDFDPLDTKSVPMCLAGKRFEIGLTHDSELYGRTVGFDDSFRAYRVGDYVYAVIANRLNPIQEVDIPTLGKIFSETETSWANVKGSKNLGRIELYSMLTGTEKGAGFDEVGMPKYRLTPTLTKFKLSPSYKGGPVKEGDILKRQYSTEDEVIDKVAKDAKAIAFFLYEPGIEKHLGPKVRILGIVPAADERAVLPSAETIANRTYPLMAPVTLTVHPEAPEMAHEFCRFFTGPRTVKVLRGAGLWPASEAATIRRALRVAEFKKGKGQAVTVTGVAGAGDEPLLKALAHAYAEAEEVIQPRYQSRPSVAAAVTRFLGEGKGGDSDLLVIAGAPPAENATALDGLEKVSLGRRALGVVVHPERNVDSLALDELQRMCRGEIKAWPTAENQGPVIRGYGLPPGHPVMGIYAEQLARAPGTRGSGALRFTPHASTIEVLASVARDPGGIGLVDISELPAEHVDIRLVGIATKDQRVSQPSSRQVPNDYPLVQAYSLYLSPTAEDQARSFARWVTKNLNDDVLLRHHLLPPSPPQPPRPPSSNPGGTGSPVGTPAEPVDAIEAALGPSS